MLVLDWVLGMGASNEQKTGKGSLARTRKRSRSWKIEAMKPLYLVRYE